MKSISMLLAFVGYGRGMKVYKQNESTYLFIQHKISNIVCILEVVFLIAHPHLLVRATSER